MRTDGIRRAVRWRSWFGGPGFVVALATVLGAVLTYWTKPQIFPDTQYYILWTERLLGVTPRDAERMVTDYITAVGSFDPYPTLYGWKLGVELTRPRVLLPVLSVPFVGLFGPGGILVVPAIAYAAYSWATYRVCRIHVAPWVAAVVTVLAVSPVQVRLWGLAALTDSLALAAVALLLLAFPWRGPTGRGRLLWIAALAGAAGLARLMAPFTMAIGGALWLWSRRRHDAATRRSWTWAFAADVAGSLAATTVNSFAGGKPISEYIFRQTGSDNWGDALRHVAGQVPHTLGVELWNAVSDPTIVAILVLVVVGLLLDRSRLAGWLTLAAVVATLTVVAVNPTPTHFRYELPAMPVLALAAALGVSAWTGRRTGRAAGENETSEPDAGAERPGAADTGSAERDAVRVVPAGR